MDALDSPLTRSLEEGEHTAGNMEPRAVKGRVLVSVALVAFQLLFGLNFNADSLADSAHQFSTCCFRLSPTMLNDDAARLVKRL
jgi:hypothetical protein